MERETGGERRAQPFARRDPGRVAGAVVVAEVRDGRGVELDPAGRRVERVRLGIGAEIGEQHEVVLGLRDPHAAVAPEILERRQACALLRHAPGEGVVALADPAELVLAAGEIVGDAEAFGEPRHDVVVAPRLAHRLDRLAHGVDRGIAAAGPEIVALQRGRRRQHDVGMARRRRPERVLHDDRLGLAPGAEQPVEVLVVVERIAPGPVHHADVGIGAPLAVEVVFAAGVQQHFGDARDRDEALRRVLAHGQTARPGRDLLAPDQAHRAVADAEPAARQADLAQHRRERDARPDRLLAPVGALQRITQRDHRPRRGHAAGERADFLRLDLAALRRPCRVFRHAVRRAVEIGGETPEARAVALEEGAVVQILGEQAVGEAQHQRGVRVGADRQPARAELLDRVVAQRADRHRLDAGRAEPRQPAARAVRAGPAEGDLQILGRHAAEAHDQPGVPSRCCATRSPACRPARRCR